jgi:prophage regulatory protein
MTTAVDTRIDRYIRLPEVQHLTGLSKAQIYALISQAQFPRQIKLGTGNKVRSSAWVESQVRQWMQDCADQSAA